MNPSNGARNAFMSMGICSFVLFVGIMHEKEHAVRDEIFSFYLMNLC